MTKAKAKKSPPAKGKAKMDCTVEEVLAMMTPEERKTVDRAKQTAKDVMASLANGTAKIEDLEDGLRRFLWFAGAQIVNNGERTAAEIAARWDNICRGHRAWLICQKGAKRIPKDKRMDDILAVAVSKVLTDIAGRYVDVEG